MANKIDRKIVLEREYVVPLRREFIKVQRYRRAKKALKALKEFMVQHMQVRDRDTRKIKVDVYLNNEIKFMGNRKPLHKVKVKAIKYDDGIVEVKLVNLPKHIEFEIARNAKKAVEIAKNSKDADKKEEKVEATAETKTEEEKSEAKIEEKDKEQESKIAEQQIDKAKAKESKHATGTKRDTEIKRKVLNR
ncbi:MAG: hypothetical protein AABX17_01040 [Nanoarchaeota archaeon]